MEANTGVHRLKLRHWVKEISKESISNGLKKVYLAQSQMETIDRLIAQLRMQKSLEGLRITGCITMTKETSVLVLALKEMGAELRWCSDNRFSLDDDVSAYIASQDVAVFGKRNMSEKEYYWCMQQALNFGTDDNPIGPDYIIDDGCDITTFAAKHFPVLLESVKGITEQTTCGINALKNLLDRGEDLPPAININHSGVKSDFDNHHGVSQSLAAALHKAAGLQISGLPIVIYGYGPVGSGAAQALRGLGAHVTVVEANPLRALKASMNGFQILAHRDAIQSGKLFILATGCVDVITYEDILKMRNGAILCNIGHGNREFQYERMARKSHSITDLSEFVELVELRNGKSVLALCKGALVNMIAGDGNAPTIMGMTFAAHIAGLFCFLNQKEGDFQRSKVHPLPEELDDLIARCVLPNILNSLYDLSEEQKEYLGLENAS